VYPRGAIKIYVSGSLSLTRGLRELLVAVDLIENVEIVCAGWIFDDYARDIFLKHSKVTYLGVISARRSLEIAATCDAIFAFYSPTTINNIQASPNKIYDAMSVGRPVIINSETLVSKWVIEKGIGFSSPYLDKQSLAAIIGMLFYHRSQLYVFSKNAHNLFSTGYSWASAETELMKLYDKLRRDVIIDNSNTSSDRGGNEFNYAMCTSCVMDTTDTDISFDDNGVCDHCNTFNTVTIPNWHIGPEGDKELNALLKKIKLEGRGKDFDCIIGMSGGIDSSYLTYLAKEQFGLRPLVFHVDAGWNSQEAVNNIEKLVDGLGLDLYTEVIDWEEMRDLQLAFFKSGVSHIDAPQDNAFFATMYKFAEQHKVKYILTGANLSTEGIRNPVQWMYYQSDSRQIRDIHRQFGARPLVNYPLTSIFRHKIYLPYIKGIKTIRPLNYVPYIKQDAMQFLIDRFGWQPYPQKHFESRFTRFYESYWLPKRFGYDVRRVQFSSLILTEQITREEALEKLKQSPFDESTIAYDLEYVANKLGISADELNSYINIPKRTYRDYKSQSQIYNLGARAMKFFGLEVGGKR
jgi:N-acetyl sugar amidotransferase